MLHKKIEDLNVDKVLKLFLLEENKALGDNPFLRDTIYLDLEREGYITYNYNIAKLTEEGKKETAMYKDKLLELIKNEIKIQGNFITEKDLEEECEIIGNKHNINHRIIEYIIKRSTHKTAI